MPLPLRARGMFVLALLPLACGPAVTNTPVVKPTAPVAPPKPPPPPVAVPSKWTLHPSGSLRMNAKLDLGSAGVLYVGDGGERWLDKAGTPAAAATLLMESIRGVARAGDGSFLFATSSGIIHSAKEPLGALGAPKTPSRKLHSVSVGKAAVLAVDDVGALVRTTDGGASWAKVDVPATDGVLLQVAMLASGEGLALMVPQRLFYSLDDGASFKALATPSVGARRVVADVNGDLMLEGLLGSALFKSQPSPHLDKVARAASSELELAMPSTEGALAYGDAIRSGRGAFVSNGYVELVQDPDNTTSWRFASLELGQKPKIRKLHELDGCENVSLGARDKTVVLGCDQQGPASAPKKSKWGYGPSYGGTQYQLKLLKSVDGGATFKDDGFVSASSAEKHIWVTPDGSLIVEGGCKKSKNEYACDDSPPVIRAPGAKGVAKVVSATNYHFNVLAFAPNGQHAYALGHDSSNRVLLFLSQNGGKDFIRKALPPVRANNKGDDAITPYGDVGGAIDAENEGAVTVLLPNGTQWLRYTTADFGTTIKGTVVPLEADAIDLAGKRGLAYEIGSGKAWETADAGLSWLPIAAPQHESTKSYPERAVACGDYGCFLGDRATRVGWDLAKPGDTATGVSVKAAPKLVGRTPLKCNVSGEWTSLGNAFMPSAGNAHLGGGTHWVIPKRDPKTGAALVMVGMTNAKGVFETKEVSLFGKADADTATQVLGQLEGAVAIRYAFKREKKVASLDKPMFMAIKKPYYPPPPAGPAIVAKQMVDVEVAWYVAATGKVQKATIKGVGPLDPIKDVMDNHALPSVAKSMLVSIAPGGVHVRPLASAATDAPLYFVRDGGKIDKLTWPDVPTKDVRGRLLYLKLEATRLGKRTVLFGTAFGGVQLFTAWANEAGTSWETRTWGLWPQLDDVRGDFHSRFFESADKLFAGALHTGGEGLKSVGWAAPLKPDADPSGAMALPTQSSLADPPPACGKDAASGMRVMLPFEKGTRHPILVSGEAQDLVLASNNMITRVNSGAPTCVAAFDSYREYPRNADNYVAIIAPDDLEHASLFKTKGWTSDGPELSVRALSCSFAKGPIPDVLEGSAAFTE